MAWTVPLKGTGPLSPALMHPLTHLKFGISLHGACPTLAPSHAEGNHSVFHLAEEYGTVIVGTPDRKNHWIMARTQAPDEARFAKFVEIAQTLGFDTGRLIRRR